MILVIGLSVFAAFLFAAAAYLQQRAGRAVVAVHPAASRVGGLLLLMRRLVHSPMWLRGWVTNLAGFLTQAGALHLGSVALVQPLLSTQLLFSLPFSAAEHRRRPATRDWVFALCVCAGLAVLVSVEGTAPLSGDPERTRVLLATASAVGVIAVLVLVGLAVPVRVRAHLTAVGAGLCFAMSAVLMKLTTEDLLHRGVGATAADWPGYLLAVSALGGLLLEQNAFVAGPLPWAIAAMSVTNPVASYVAGMLAFHVPFPTDASRLAIITGAGALVVVGISGLAHSPLAQAFYAGSR